MGVINGLVAACCQRSPSVFVFHSFFNCHALNTQGNAKVIEARLSVCGLETTRSSFF